MHLGTLGVGADAHGIETERWMLSRIDVVIRAQFGVEFHPNHLARPLRARGWPPQRLANQAVE
jgi:hypothetical protein